MVKKTFKTELENPVMNFISIDEQEEVVAEQEAPTTEEVGAVRKAEIQEGYKVNYNLVETKSRRLQLLVQPSLHAKLKAKAQAEGRSLNDYIHEILEKALND